MVSKALSRDDFVDAEVIETQSAEDVSIQQADTDEQINSIFSEVGSDKNDVTFHFSVWRILKDQADMAFLFKGTPADLPLMERLRDEYDGGKFHIQVYKNKKRYRRLTVTVETPKRTAVSIVKNDMAELVREMGKQQQENFNMLKDTVLQMVGKPSTPQPSQMEMMTGMMMLMKNMKDFVSPAVHQPPAFDSEKMFDMFLKGMEMGRESNSDGETGLMGIAKELIKSPLLGSLVQAANTQPALPRRVNPSDNPTLARSPKVEMGPTATPTGPTVPTSPGDTNNMQPNILKHYLNVLVQKAEKDSDPVLYAEFILDNVPQSMIEQNIMRDDLIEYASTIDPRVKQHAEWFMELRDHIHGVLTGEGEDTDTVPDADTTSHITDHSAGGGGDTPDP